MSFTIPHTPSFIERHWRFVLFVVIFLILCGVALYGLSRVWSRADAVQTLSQATRIRNGLNLYYYYHRDFPPTGGLLSPINLGQGEAVCLDKTEAGLNNICPQDAILPILPGGFQYQKTVLGDYNLAFILAKSVAGFKDANKDGKIVCLVNAQELRCQ